MVDLASDKDQWYKAHDAFQAVRALTLRARDVQDSLDVALLYIAETTAKVVYNASESPAPFDSNAGWYLAPILRHFCALQRDPTFDDQAWSALTTSGW